MSIYFARYCAGSWELTWQIQSKIPLENSFLHSFSYTRIFKYQTKMAFYDFFQDQNHYYLFPNLGGWINTWKRWLPKERFLKGFGAPSKDILNRSSFFFWSNHYSFLAFLSNLTQKNSINFTSLFTVIQMRKPKEHHIANVTQWDRILGFSGHYRKVPQRSGHTHLE